ncbi:hypothetical protein [Nocardia ignorata]|uniref:Uncharacterized protein n=1 Tax=Nocardia ignorata TaxID=145285 RepID=A0A4R6NYI5_NOCIG|nr:hypothetical protein [Nocardia ignorata]TDP29749.1 hypothetical protein DFR75_11210 [Nocardia ignorata]
MTAPNEPIPNGSIEPGDFTAFQAMTPEDVQTSLKAGAKVSYSNAHGTHGTEVRSRINGAYDAITVVEGYADQAVNDAQAAANAAANAVDIADKAYLNSSFWIIECVVASAAVVLGDNELLLGPVLNVPDDQDAFLTDVHIALLSQPAGMTIDCKKWNATGTSFATYTSAVIGANVTRYNIPLLEVQVFDKERFFYTVPTITGSTAPQVLQIAVAGVFTPKP